MRLIDLEQIKFIEKNRQDIQVISDAWELDIANSPYMVGYEQVENLCKKLVQQINQDYVYFEIIITEPNFSKAQGENFAYVVGNEVLSLVIKTGTRNRESRLTVPQQLGAIPKLAHINILKAINNETLVKGFGGRIEVNGKKFYLLGNR